MTDQFYANAESFVSWLERRVIEDARGDREDERQSKPGDRFWLGRLATEAEARRIAATERVMRLDPCAVGFTFQPQAKPPWRWLVTFQCKTWRAQGSKDEKRWYKSKAITAHVKVEIGADASVTHRFGEDEIRKAFTDNGDDHHFGLIEVEINCDTERPLVTVTVVNQSPEISGRDDAFYEVSLSVDVGSIQPFILDSLPDSFRYDRRVDAYGVNCGVDYLDGTLTTADFVCADRYRPCYWDETLGSPPSLRFDDLSRDPKPLVARLLDALEQWVERDWGRDALDARATIEGWSESMVAEAILESGKARDEVRRCRDGLKLLDTPLVLRAFKLMNRAFVYSGQGKYDSWRPFQIGFLLAALSGIVHEGSAARSEVSTLWFATGGGKTETYLAAIVFAAFYDRLSGKTSGLTAWSRFPLRMLSLQQTQRFADALAAAERVRREEAIDGDPISLGYFVGNNGTPNRVRQDPKSGEADADDPAMPARYQVLLYCPFCRDEKLRLTFDESTWCLCHQCTNSQCSWPTSEALPFYVVDEEIYRFLPTVVVGTLDKAASIAIQAAMRGFYAAPLGKCTGPSHGFTYASRSAAPNGCLVPGCQFSKTGLPQPEARFAPRLRIQDELHLLADSLGAIDSHYETLLDHLTTSAGGPIPKILASSATLMGFKGQVRALYDRDGAAFPLPGPSDARSFWSLATAEKMRRFVALAPRGKTQEFANDRIAESLQQAIRDFIASPVELSREAKVDPRYADRLVDYYGVHVIYGSKLRDVEGAARSLESQPPADPTNVATLTGSTALSSVLAVLRRLQAPETEFADRIHIVCASAMMSHGVDVDRFNVMTMIGMPLKTSEFIQTSARIGRRYPGLLIVLHRMAVERDAKIFRSFAMFVRHGDRLIEPIAITRNSRRVLERTAPGMFMSDVLGLYEPDWLSKGNKALTTPKELRKYVRSRVNFQDVETRSMEDALRVDPESQSPMVVQLENYVGELMSNINDPAAPAKFTSDLAPGKVLISLRDVEERIPIREAIS